ncbi:hypothetical protein [Sphingomonas sp.]|uniref:hypothetical protein n=1 Tax=Sphingomonas sp. TaxID=28214 RepID=UPI00179AAAAD|nr:hypothetical protein [Sphingomonas sp.]MBA3511909.1 hypothetical protein [Sphingomonas sp.]
MRLTLPFAALLLAGCATAPSPPQAPLPQPPPTMSAPPMRGELIGMTASELVQRLGTPALQIREGRSLKLQFRGSRCILDAYLYPPRDASGPERVAHVDARLRSGVETDPRTCIASMSRA